MWRQKRVQSSQNSHFSKKAKCPRLLNMLIQMSAKDILGILPWYNYNQWSVLLLSLLTVLTPWHLTPHIQARGTFLWVEVAEPAQRQCLAMLINTATLTSTKKSLLPPRCLWFRNQISSSAVRRKRRPSAHYPLTRSSTWRYCQSLPLTSQLFWAQTEQGESRELLKGWLLTPLSPHPELEIKCHILSARQELLESRSCNPDRLTVTDLPLVSHTSY